MNIDEAYSKFVKQSEFDGEYKAKCVEGLFEVYGFSQERVDMEARHYFAQYWADREYDHLIGEDDD